MRTYLSQHVNLVLHYSAEKHSTTRLFFITKKGLGDVIHTFISFLLNNSNSLYKCLNQHSGQGFQLVPNAAVRLLTETKKRDNITPVVPFLLWLPMNFRIDFEI